MGLLCEVAVVQILRNKMGRGRERKQNKKTKKPTCMEMEQSATTWGRRVWMK